MEGGTTFHFVTDGIESALAQAREAAGDGRRRSPAARRRSTSTSPRGLIDELRLHIAPVSLGAGERLFDGVPPLELEQIGEPWASLVTHVRYRVSRPAD